MEDFFSEELRNARISPSSFTDTIKQSIDLESLKNDLKVHLITKDKTLLKPYEIAALYKANPTASGNDVLRSLLTVIKEFYTNKFKEDNFKNILIRKNIDVFFLLLDGLLISGIDISSNEMHALMVSFVSKNCL